ncbi:MAG: ROK family protein [Oscillospiraceae bacterium]|nr:ROK family protein [Oscillospiraceae bacterium]
MESAVGRKPALITLSRKSRYAVGVHVQTHIVSAAIVDFSGEVLLQESKNILYKGTPDYWTALSEYVDSLIESLDLEKARIAGIKVAIPAIFFPMAWKAVGIRDDPEGIVGVREIGAYFTYPAQVIPIAEAAGTTRIWYGAVENNTIVIELARFIDGCYIYRESLTGIRRVRTFDIGHISINKDGKRCFCGKNGCLQAYCSTSGLIDRVNGIDTTMEIVSKSRGILHWNEFIRQMEAGNQEYRALFDEYIDALAYFINNIRIAFGADIVICGDITHIIEKYKPELVRRIQALSPSWKQPEDVDAYLHTSSFAGYQASVGAALSVFDDLIEKI